MGTVKGSPTISTRLFVLIWAKKVDVEFRTAASILRTVAQRQGAGGNARSYTTHQIHLSPFRPNLPTYLPQIWSILR